MDWKTPPLPVEDRLIVEEHRADVVVVGLGYAGSAAMRAAQEAGVSVIGIESQPEERYTLFGRDVGHINSRFLRSRGVPRVEPGDLFDEWMHRAGNRANPGLVRQFCDKSGEAFDWYTDMYDLEGLKDVHVAFWPEGADKFKAAIPEGANSINRYRFWYGTAEFPDPMGWQGAPTLPACAKANLEKARAAGAGLFFGMRAVQPVMEGDRVIGIVAADREERLYRFRADRAVILAAGDFGGNSDMLRDLCPDVADVLSSGAKLRSMGRKGDGIRIGVWAGGRLESRPIPTMAETDSSRWECAISPLSGSTSGGAASATRYLGAPSLPDFPAIRTAAVKYWRFLTSTRWKTNCAGQSRPMAALTRTSKGLRKICVR